MSRADKAESALAAVTVERDAARQSANDHKESCMEMAMENESSKASGTASLEELVTRFLGWRLPENFTPDGGISFDPIMNRGHAFESKREPVGTNLFDASQAKAMLEYVCGPLLSRASTAEQALAAVIKERDAARKSLTSSVEVQLKMQDQINAFETRITELKERCEDQYCEAEGAGASATTAEQGLADVRGRMTLSAIMDVLTADYPGDDPIACETARAKAILALMGE